MTKKIETFSSDMVAHICFIFYCRTIPVASSTKVNHLNSLSDILRFDNSYSWTRNKKIFYNVTIVYPLKDSNGHVGVS